MNSEERKEYIKYRIEKAYQTYEAAKVLADNGFWNSAVNRLYYSLFFAANALLVLNGIEVKRHATLKSQFSQNFVKTGKFDKNMAVCYLNSTTGAKKPIMTWFLIMMRILFYLYSSL